MKNRTPIRAASWLAVALCALLSTAPVASRDVETSPVLPAGLTVKIPVHEPSGDDVAMVTQVFLPPGDGPFPVVVFSHGRPPGAKGRADLTQGVSRSQLRYWLARGAAVVSPVRPGYGPSPGGDVEQSGVRHDKAGRCISTPDFSRTADAAALTVSATLAWLRSQRWADARHVLLVGQSVGGLTTVAAAAQHPAGVVGYINFAGGSGGNPERSPGISCDPDQLTRLYAAYGLKTTLPNLWIYAANDQYWGPDEPRAWHAAFARVAARPRSCRRRRSRTATATGCRATPRNCGARRSTRSSRRSTSQRRPPPIDRLGLKRGTPMPDHPVVQIQPLGFPWETIDPFLFCVHHDNAYPKGNGRFGPDVPLAGRNIGQDFARKDGWNMYHGDTVPGFPSHPHRGFETVTIVRKGLTDHSDSLGAAARFGGGDVQWLTAGKGIVHSEMFPLLDVDRANPLELFQIWLNLPARSKMADPHFTMLWAEDIPHRFFAGPDGATTEVACIAGRFEAPARSGEGEVPELVEPLAPPPDSWAAQPAADVAIWTLRMEPGARWTMPPSKYAATRRKLYFFAGASVAVAGEAITAHASIELRSTSVVEIVNTGSDVAEFLMLQGRPIGEPVAQYGPFVMNTQDELKQAFADYRRTEFGGWPWPDHGPVHGPEPVRFARHADGHTETRDAVAP